MPYSIDRPDELPENVQELPDNLKRQWIRVWNSVYQACTDEGGDDCEGKAYTQANGVIKKRKENMSDHFIYIDLQTLQPGKPFDGVAPGEFVDMWGRDVKINAKDFPEYVKNTKSAIEHTKTDEGELVGLPIDARGHADDEAAGWIVDVFEDETELPDGKAMKVIRFVAKWTEVGRDLIEKNVRRMFSPTINTKDKVILGGSLTNWPASRDKTGKVLLRPVALSLPAYTNLADQSYDEKSQIIRDAWYKDKLGEKQPSMVESSPGWIAEVFDDYVIIDKGGTQYFKVPYYKDEEGEIAFAGEDEWKPVKKAWVDMVREAISKAIDSIKDLLSSDLASFDESDWDAGAVKSGLDVSDLRRVCLLDLNGYPGQEGDPTKGLCKLPIRTSPGAAINKNALRAAGGGARGIAAVTKPDGVPQDWYDGRLKAAANKIISLWKSAFDNPAPEAVYRIAGKERPAEAQLPPAPENTSEPLEGENTMTTELTNEQLQKMIEEETNKRVQAIIASNFPNLGAPGQGEGDAGDGDKVDVIAMLGLSHLDEEAQKRIEETLQAQYEHLQKQAEAAYITKLAFLNRKREMTELANRLVSGTEDAPRGLPVKAEELATAMLDLPVDQVTFWKGLLNNVVQGGLVEYAELGHGKDVDEVRELPEYYAEKLRAGELKLADLRDPIIAPDLGDLKQYDLSEFKE